MINFLPAVPEYANDKATQTVWDWVFDQFKDVEGVGYYKYPVVRATTGAVPELSLILRTHQPIAIRCLPITIDEIESINNDIWIVRGQEIDSPILELEDFVVGLQSNFDRERALRNKFEPKAALALPLIKSTELLEKFGKTSFDKVILICVKDDTTNLVEELENPLSEGEWRLLRAVVQGVRPISGPYTARSIGPAKTLGEAIKELEKQIALLDFEQEKVAIPIAPGPQRIRGLAGTGKTVLLAMKAANIHKHYPDKKILFTFNTQSLYNQTKSLITKFYRYHTDVDPDWEKIHIRHGWGGHSRPGVYYDLASSQGVIPMNLNMAKGVNPRFPFQAVCQRALSLPIDPVYDYVLVDEAQDFPREFLQILYRLSRDPHCVYWAYDDLQSLFSIEIPKPEELFGMDDKGKPLVTLEGEDYPGRIEKDLILKQSYRCPPQVLMVAHAIGLGLYSKRGCVQMLPSVDSWNAIGYEITKGNLTKDSEVEIFRPPENSPNRISEIYKGDQSLVTVNVFSERAEELKWIAESIERDVREQGIAPESIVVISLDAFEAKTYTAQLQYMLSSMNIESVIPGFIDDTAVFAELGRVTLSTVHRAKGNEAPIIYILGFESLYDYVNPVENRNKAFTSISRAKAFVRITGVGPSMQEAKNEIDGVLRDFPYFRFIFPDMGYIKNLDAQTGKRRREVEKAKDSASELVRLDPEAIAALRKTNPELFNKLTRLIEGVKGENK
jgi:superfamily I DNA and RNA helicase